MTTFTQELMRLSGAVLPNEPLCRHTTWRIGGPAEVLVVPATQEDVVQAISVAQKHNKPITVIGNGSNILAADAGVEGLVLKLVGGLNEFSIEGCILRAEAGCLLPGLAQATVNSQLSGLEFAAGIPASLGGALVMNAGAHGGELGRLIQEVLVCSLTGEVLRMDAAQCNFGYRQSVFQQTDYIILSASLQLHTGNQTESREMIKENLQRRKASQPLELPNAGSVFRNPAQGSAGKFIEQAGAKGLTVGGAMVSEKHANFIVNIGSATANDVLVLIERVQELVLNKFNILLHPEIRIIGCSRE